VRLAGVRAFHVSCHGCWIIRKPVRVDAVAARIAYRPIAFPGSVCPHWSPCCLVASVFSTSGGA